MNELLLNWGLAPLKALLSFLLLPPLPLLALALWGGWWRRRRPLAGALLLALALAGLWLSATPGLAEWMKRTLLRPPPALQPAQIAALQRAPDTAIVVLGGGRRALAPEYGQSSVTPLTAERLRYGIWLARQTRLPLAYTGGIAPGAPDGPTEAEVAARVAAQEYGLALRWREDASKDTRENALRTVALLQPEGIRRIVLVTHDFHMPRALDNFRHAALHAGMALELVPAPLGLPQPGPFTAGDWLPGGGGAQQVWLVWREVLGRLAGA